MRLIEQYKAEIITFLIMATLVLALFSIQLRQKGQLISESYYELEPEPEIIEKLQETSKDIEGNSSDKAYNEDQEFKELMRNFKMVRSDDFEQTTKALEENKSEITEEINNKESLTTNGAYALKSSETEAFKKLQQELNKHRDNKNTTDEHTNNRSTLTYSLKGRTLEYYKTPRYLCEFGGKIVVSIRVNEDGHVFETSINGASNSRNQCLVDSAMEYAQSAKFNPSSRTDQLGTITFIFKGKS